MLRTLLHKTLLTAMLILLGGWAVVAQQYVVKGASLSFKVDENAAYKFHWSVTNTSTGAVAYLKSKTHESGDYQFMDAGTYEVKVYPEDLGTHCFGDALTMTVVVDQAAPTAVFEDLDVPYVCSSNNGSDANGKLLVKVKYEGPKPWTFKYSIDKAPAIMPAGAENIFTDEFELELEIPNISGKTHQAEILLVEAKTVSGIPVEEDLDNQTLMVSVMALPNTQWLNYEAVVQAGTTQSFEALIDKVEDYKIIAPAEATVQNESTAKYDKHNNKLTFDVLWANTPGDYQIKLFERNGFDCAGDTVYANVKVVESFTVDLGADIAFCQGESAVLKPQIDFDGTYTYLWSNGTTESTLTVTEDGTYSVTATDTKTGKKATDDIKVTVWTSPVVDLGADYQLADGEEITLDAGNPGMTYAWSTGETTQTIKVSTSNTYNVTVTNANGCTGSDEIVVTSVNDMFAINLGDDKDICEGEEIILDPQPTISQTYTYLWSNGANTSTLTVNESGTYSVTVQDESGNVKTDEIVVNVHALPIVDLGEDIVLYDGETADLDAGNPGSTYDWSTGETTQQITVSTENIYSVQVTNEFGCKNADDISVVKRNGHKFTVDLGGDKNICEGDRIYLEPVIDRSFDSDPTYKWIPGESTEKGIYVDKSGKYCVDVTDPNGNTEQDCIEVTVHPSPIVDLGEDRILEAGQSVTLDAENSGSFYRWSNDAITQTILVDQAGEYWVEVTNQQSCMGRDTVKVEFPDGDAFFGLPTAFTPNGDGKNDILYVRGNNITSMSLIILNRLGTKIFQSNRQDVGWDGTYKGQKQDMDAYVYVLKVTLIDGRTIQKRGNVSLLY
jgi:gliding motility-associated-like protein